MEIKLDRPEPLQISQIELPTGTDPVSIRRRVEALEMLLERSFRIPGVNVPVGLDALIGLVPVIGMGGNVAFDTVLGLVPVVGDAADFVFRSNTRNLRIIKKHLDKHHPETRVIEG